MTWQYVIAGLAVGILVGMTGMGGGSLMTPMLHSGGGTNFGSYKDTMMDSLLDKLGTATSPSQVLDLTKQCDAYVRDQVPYLFMGWPTAATITQPYLHGNSNNLYVYMFYYGIGNWRSVWMDPNAPNNRGGKAV